MSTRVGLGLYRFATPPRQPRNRPGHLDDRGVEAGQALEGASHHLKVHMLTVSDQEFCGAVTAAQSFVALFVSEMLAQLQAALQSVRVGFGQDREAFEATRQSKRTTGAASMPLAPVATRRRRSSQMRLSARSMRTEVLTPPSCEVSTRRTCTGQQRHIYLIGPHVMAKRRCGRLSGTWAVGSLGSVCQPLLFLDYGSGWPPSERAQAEN